jgi:hypothetical protein
MFSNVRSPMTKHRLETLTRIFSAFYRANMTPEELVGSVSHDVCMRPKRSRRDDLWEFNRLAMKTRLAMATEYVSYREETEKNKPALYHAFYTDTNVPGSNYYDAAHGEWNLISTANGHFRWEATPINRRMSSVSFSSTTVDAFYPALIKLAIGLHAAFLISERDVLPRGFRAVIVSPGEKRFRECGPNYEAAAVPDGTVLLFHGEPEENGRIVIWPDGGTDRYGITVWGKFFAVQIDSGFQSSYAISVP